MGKKGKSDVQEKWSAQKNQTPSPAPGIDDVRSEMLRVGRLIIDHPIVKLGLRVGDTQQRNDIALITKWVESEEKVLGR